MRKRDQGRDDDDEPNDSKSAKRIKAMLSLLKQEEFDVGETIFIETTFVVSIDLNKIVQIPIPKLYSKAIANPTYRLEWRAAI